MGFSRRVVAKVTGEALSGVGEGAKRPFNGEAVSFLIDQFMSALQFFEFQLQLIVVVGGGNFFRGRELKESMPDMRTARAHVMGMNNTENNGIALRQQFLNHPLVKKRDTQVRLMNALGSGQTGEPYFFEKAEHHLQNGRIVICVGGTGVPFFSTDTGAVIRALELEADMILKCSKCAIYDKDPVKYEDAKFLPRLTYQECRERDLGIIDKQAIGTLLEQPPEMRMPIAVFNVFEDGAFLNVLRGQHERASFICEPTWAFSV